MTVAPGAESDSGGSTSASAPPHNWAKVSSPLSRVKYTSLVSPFP